MVVMGWRVWDGGYGRFVCVGMVPQTNGREITVARDQAGLFYVLVCQGWYEGCTVATVCSKEARGCFFRPIAGFRRVQVSELTPDRHPTRLAA